MVFVTERFHDDDFEFPEHFFSMQYQLQLPDLVKNSVRCVLPCILNRQNTLNGL